MTSKTLNDILLGNDTAIFSVTLFNDFDQLTVAAVLKQLDSQSREYGLPSSLITRLKTISVEILQNISKHSSQLSELSPYFVLHCYPEKVIIYSGNTIVRKTKDLINERLIVYKGLTKEELKDFYRHSLGHTSISESGNAGIGLLDIVYRSGQQVEWSFEEENTEFCFFRMVVNVSQTPK